MLDFLKKILIVIPLVCVRAAAPACVRACGRTRMCAGAAIFVHSGAEGGVRMCGARPHACTARPHAGACAVHYQNVCDVRAGAAENPRTLKVW